MLSVDADVTAIHEACAGFGTDENKLINILGQRTPRDAAILYKAYKANYGKDLYEVIKSETSGEFGEAIRHLTISPAIYDAESIHLACKGAGTDESTLLEILVGRFNDEIEAIKIAYKTTYGKDLETVISSELGGNLKNMMIMLLQAARDETNSHANVEADVEAFYKAGEGKLGTDESTFIRIICNRSDAHLKNVFAAYAQKYGHSFEKAITGEFSGDLEKALLYLFHSIVDKADHVAQLLEKSMSGLGTNERALTRLIVRNRGPNMRAIAQAYSKRYGKSLGDRISGETSGDYRKLLVTIVNA